MSKRSLSTSTLSNGTLRSLAKAELHCHLDGSIRPSTILALAKANNISLLNDRSTDQVTLDELQNILVVADDCPSLEEYLRGFSVTLAVLQDETAITRVVFEVAQDAVADGCVYLEIRFSPILHQQRGLTLSQVMRAATDGVHAAEAALPITVRLIVCGMRHMSPDDSRALAEVAWRHRSQGVVAFDLAGPEAGFPSTLHRDAVTLARTNALNVTLHAGEGAGANYIVDAIRSCGAHRIGHGCALINDPSLLRFVADRGIALEVCPTSNVQTKAVASIADHPIRAFFDAGVVVCPSTDNRTISGITLTSELALLQREFSFSPVELLRMLDYSFSVAFLPHLQRERIRANALFHSATVLHREGVDLEPILTHPQFANLGFGAAEVAAAAAGKAPTSEVQAPTAATDLTAALLRALPKADIHVRFDGAVSPAFVHDRLSADARASLPPAMRDATSADAFATAFREHARDADSFAATKAAWLSTLQTADDIAAAVSEIVTTAAADGVTYLELALRPTAHTAGSLSLDDVVSTAGAALAAAAAAADITAGLVLVAKPVADSPLAVHAIATATVAGVAAPTSAVVGFALYGDEEFMHSRVTDYYGDALSLLKQHNVPVAASAGQEDGASVMAALQVAGACRISGAFVVHAHPDIVAHLAQHRVPVELSPSPQMRRATADVETFQRTTPFRVLLDQGVPVSLCTIRGGMARHTRVQTLEYLVRTSNLSAADVCALLANGFSGAFAPLATRQRLEAHFWREARRLLPNQAIRPRRYFPAPTRQS